jgi:peptide deformylase
MFLDILKYPDKRLREKSTSVPKEKISSKDFQTLLDNMFDTMYGAPGVGLAAVQIGILQRVMVLDIGIQEGEMVKRDPHVLINPEFIQKSGSLVWEEGCLSCPELIVPVQRSQQVSVRGLDRKGKPVEMAASQLLAVVLQHEIDHMDGVLIFDKLSRLKQDLYKDKVKKGQIVR